MIETRTQLRPEDKLVSEVRNTDIYGSSDTRTIVEWNFQDEVVKAVRSALGHWNIDKKLSLFSSNEFVALKQTADINFESCKDHESKIDRLEYRVAELEEIIKKAGLDRKYSSTPNDEERKIVV